MTDAQMADVARFCNRYEPLNKLLAMTDAQMADVAGSVTGRSFFFRSAGT